MGGLTGQGGVQVNQVVDQKTRERAATDFAHNIVVEAGAGTGKTTLMVERTVYALVDRGIPIERMALITFMEKAAKEIRARLESRLQTVAGEAGDTEAGRRARRALDLLPGSAITTIHGFAMRLLQTAGHHAAVPMNFRVMDVYEQDQLFAETFRNWLQTDPGAARRTQDLLTLGLPFERFQSMAKFLSGEPDVPPCRAVKPDLGWMEEVIAASEERVSQADIAQRDDQGWLQMQGIRRFCLALQALPRDGWYRALGAWNLTAPKGNRKKWTDPAALVEQKAWVASLKESVDTFRQALADYLLSEFLDLVQGSFLPYWKAARWRSGQLTFDDLLWEARDFLRQGSDHERLYDMIMVDEFQDTDPVQAEIIVRTLTPAWRGDWTKAPVPAGSLFVVGDPKQSIYRFRGASVETYQRVREKLQQEGALLLDIVQNFRSRPEIISPVNALFAANWPDHFDPARPYVSPYTPLAPFLPPDGVRRLWVEGGPVDKNAYDERLFQARTIAAWLQTHVRSGQLNIADPATGLARPAQLGDVALLIPNRTGMAIYQDALAQAGMAVAPEGGIRFFERDEVRGFQQLLSALRQPQQALHTAAWLSSPWVGISHAELAAHKQRGGTFAYLEDSGQGAETVVRALAQLRQWRGQWWSWRAEDFFWALYDWSALPAVLEQRQDRGGQANLEKMADLSRDLGDAWGSDGFCQWLEKKVRQRDKEEEGALPHIEDAVHIFTVHRAKGLEWPVVIVANWQSAPANAHPGLRIESGRVAMAAGDLQSRDWEALDGEERLRAAAERERLYYVALTRARDYLLVVDTYPPDKPSAWSLHQRMGRYGVAGTA